MHRQASQEAVGSLDEAGVLDAHYILFCGRYRGIKCRPLSEQIYLAMLILTVQALWILFLEFYLVEVLFKSFGEACSAVVLNGRVAS